MVLACSLGVMPCDGTHQVQILLNLLVPKLEAVVVQGMHFSCFSSHGTGCKP